MTEDVLIEAEGGCGRITLNRPQALHALTEPMCAKMSAALMTWRNEEAVRVVLLQHKDGTRGFCAGGDIRMAAESGAVDGVSARAFFHTEYRLNHLMFHYPKPIVAVMDGVTMGGGVGTAMPARYRIATERTLFAMPEAGIGLFPDVGGGWHLPRLPGEIGLWLALTGARLKAADCVTAKIATHYAPSDALGAVCARVMAAAGARDCEGQLQEGLDASNADAGAAIALTPETVHRIDRLFDVADVASLMVKLEQDGSDWAKAQLAALKTKSPQTLKVALRQLREGAQMTRFADEMIQEYRIAARVATKHDFREGVRALLIDKDNAPRWDPARLEDVTDAMLDEIFAPLPPEEEWTPLAGVEGR